MLFQKNFNHPVILWFEKAWSIYKHVDQKQSAGGNQSKVLLDWNEFADIVKKCDTICLQDLCLPQDTRQLFEDFEFRVEDAAGLMWSYIYYQENLMLIL